MSVSYGEAIILQLEERYAEELFMSYRYLQDGDETNA